MFSNDVILGFDSNGGAVIQPKEHRPRGTLILGGTGYGKSKALESIVCQDLLARPRTGCGMALFDPHGQLIDNCLSFCAARGFDHLPIIPLDCRRLDTLLCFNPIRSRLGIEPATIVSACIDSLLLAWGQSADDQNSTPRLEKWLRTVLLTIFLSGGTLGDSLLILRSPGIRRAIVRTIEDDVAQSVWQSAACLKESEFSTITESLSNRIIRFVSTTLMRLCLNQTGPSLDFGEAIRKGAIVFISLATAGGVIDEIDARTLGCLLLSDLWLAARTRGKGEAGQRRSFRIILDEFSRFLSPTMSEQLAECRGFGIEMTLCCQSLSQMTTTITGKQILNAVLANCYTKVIFNVQHPDDLEILSPWLFRNEVDVSRVKHQAYSTKVLGHKIQYFNSTSRAITRGVAESTNWSETENINYSIGTNHSHSDAVARSHSTERNNTRGHNHSRAISNGQSRADSLAESVQQGSTESLATGRSQSRSRSNSDSRQLTGGYDDLRKITGPKPTATFDSAYMDRYEGHRQLRRSIGNSKTNGESHSDTELTGSASTRSTSRARAMQNSQSSNESTSNGLSESDGTGESDGVSLQYTDSSGVNESMSMGVAFSHGGSSTKSKSVTNGVASSPMLIPQLGKEALPPQYRSVDEQLFIYSQQLAAQPDRVATVRIGINPPVQITTPTIAPAAITPKGARAWATLKLKQLPFALTCDEATRRLGERRKQFERKYLGGGDTGEPTRFVRRIKE